MRVGKQALGATVPFPARAGQGQPGGHLSHPECSVLAARGSPMDWDTGSAEHYLPFPLLATSRSDSFLDRIWYYYLH